MKRLLLAVLAVAIASITTGLSAQTKINTSFSQVTGETKALTWVLHGDTRVSIDTGNCLPNSDEARLDLEGRAAIGHTREDGEYTKTVDRLVARAMYSSIGEDLNLYASGDVISEFDAGPDHGSDYTIRVSTGLERAVEVGLTKLRGRFGFGLDWDRYQDHNTDAAGLVTGIDLVVPLPAGDLTLQTEAFRSKDVFTFQHYGTLSARLTGNVIATVNLNLLKQRDRDLHTEILAGVGYAF